MKSKPFSFIGICAIWLLAGIWSYGQQFPIMDQYLVTPSSLAPSFAGKDFPFEAFLTSRIEWTNLPGHPVLGSLNLSGTLPHHMGVGGNVLYNKAGPLENLTVNVGLAYHLQIAQNHLLHFGLNGAYYQNVLDLSNAVLRNPNDPLLSGLNSISEGYFNVGTSLLYSWKALDACVAFPLLFNNKSFYHEESIYQNVLTMDRNFLVYLGYTLVTKSDWSARFSFLYRQTQFTPWSFDVTARALYKDIAWMGLLYRKNNIIGITGGANIAKGLIFNYTYEYSPTAMMGKTSGTHEISLGYILIPKPEKPSLKEYIQ